MANVVVMNTDDYKTLVVLVRQSHVDIGIRNYADARNRLYMAMKLLEDNAPKYYRAARGSAKTNPLLTALCEQLDDSEKCICCGGIIPEGRQVCPVCEDSTASEGHSGGGNDGVRT